MRLNWKLFNYRLPNGSKRALEVHVPTTLWLGLATIMLLLLENKTWILTVCVTMFLIGGFFYERPSWEKE